MEEWLIQLNRIADYIFNNMVMPPFSVVSHLLSIITVDPMTRAGIPVALQITAFGALTALCSMLLGRIAGNAKDEAEFQKVFHEKISSQKDMTRLSDWKIKKILMEASDNELDEIFNEYIAGKYVRYATTYLIPITFAEIWLNHVFNASKLMDMNGVIWVLPLPDNSFGMEGISVSALFLATYLFFLFCFFILRRIINKQKKI